MAIRTGTVRRVWFAIRTAMEIFLAIVGEIFVKYFDFYNITCHKAQTSSNYCHVLYVFVLARTMLR